MYNYNGNNPLSIERSNTNIKNIGFIPQIFSKSLVWPDLNFLSDAFSFGENTFSAIAGVIDGIRKIKGMKNLARLEKISNWLMGIGIGLNVGLSIYDNFIVDNNYSTARKWGNFVGDGIYIGLSATITWGAGALVAIIPIFGPFIALPVATGVGYVFDQLWYGNWLEIDGKSIDEHIKDFFTKLFGG